MSFVPAIRKRRARQNPLVRWLGVVDAAMRRPIDRDIAAGHIAFARLVERRLAPSWPGREQ